jgi:hypothetical protein
MSAAHKNVALGAKHRENISKAQKKRFEDPAVVEKHKLSIKTHWEDQEARIARGIATKQMWQNPETRAKILSGLHKHFEDPIARSNASAAAKKRYEDPVEIEKIRAAAAEHWADPAIRKKMQSGMIGRQVLPETRSKISAANRKYYEDPTNRAKVSGANGSRWQGGLSFEPYCPKFNNDLKRRIRAFFEYRCTACGKPTEENISCNGNIRQLSCHHVEYNKQACCDGKPVQFAALCSKHHSMTNQDRDRWEPMLHRVIDEMYDGRSYYTKSEYSERYINA